MAQDPLSDKERALIESVRRDAGKPLSPLDAPTVVGWDNPAAQASDDQSGEKWARVAALVEMERRDAEEKRRTARRHVMIGFVVLLLLAGLLVMLVTAR